MRNLFISVIVAILTFSNTAVVFADNILSNNLEFYVAELTHYKARVICDGASACYDPKTKTIAGPHVKKDFDAAEMTAYGRVLLAIINGEASKVTAVVPENLVRQKVRVRILRVPGHKMDSFCGKGKGGSCYHNGRAVVNADAGKMLPNFLGHEAVFHALGRKHGENNLEQRKPLMRMDEDKDTTPKILRSILNAQKDKK